MSDVGKIKIATDRFISKARHVHGDKYDYSKSVYFKTKEKLEIICKRCNQSFWMQPNNHYSGQNCSHCYGTKKLTTRQFIERSENIHGDIFDYSEVYYTNNSAKVIITCKNCNIRFSQAASYHMGGGGCDYCDQIKSAKKRSKTLDQFIIDSKKIHGENTYDYSLANYINSSVKLTIKCVACNNIWNQLPTNHLSGKGCLNCCLKTSKGEVSWLNSLLIDKKYRQKTIWCGKNRYVVDAFIPKIKTIYEYYGDFWHGNPKTMVSTDINRKSGLTFQEHYNKTLKKEAILKANGYKVISIWESDWQNV